MRNPAAHRAVCRDCAGDQRRHVYLADRPTYWRPPQRAAHEPELVYGTDPELDVSWHSGAPAHYLVIELSALRSPGFGPRRPAGGPYD